MCTRKGLKFGIYTDAGTKTCQGRPGTLRFEDEGIGLDEVLDRVTMQVFVREHCDDRSTRPM
jgi:hypothetical protein